MTSLNPIHKCGKQIREPILLHTGRSKNEADRLCVHLLSQVGIPNPDHVFNMYPHQLSGGMRQRVMIAMALACRPQLLIADEPTTALDVTIEAQIVALLKTLKAEINTGIMLITHNLGLVAELCDRVIVMYTGYCMEESRIKDLIKDPLHPYTKGLLSSIPRITGDGERLSPISGSVPNPTRMPAGCSFHPRCDEVMPICKETLPELTKMDDGRSVRCWKYA
jgi:oligopeptide/dipeptide ABC transporter ATP-binding protein